MAYYHSKYSTARKKKRPRWARFLIWMLLLLIILSLLGGYYLYQAIAANNVWTPEDESVSVYIPTGSEFEEVKQILYSNGVILNRNTFEWLARQKKYPELVKAGHFMITPGMSNDELINMLRLGTQVPVKVVFNNIRMKDQLAQKVSEQIEADSAVIMSLLNDSAYQEKFNLGTKTALTLFIPNTYEFYWNTDAEQFMDRMYRENRAFWEGSRERKAEELDLKEEEVVILASIVEKETNKNDEKATIAGVYLNRLNKNWLLQADPTLVYASGDFGLTRVLNVHKEIDSPYNTYKYAGLPPGPICIPSIASIDAVLNAEEHDYLFFCAKDDLSGYHAFARSITQHNRNARKYRKAIENR